MDLSTDIITLLVLQGFLNFICVRLILRLGQLVSLFEYQIIARVKTEIILGQIILRVESESILREMRFPLFLNIEKNKGS